MCLAFCLNSICYSLACCLCIFGIKTNTFYRWKVCFPKFNCRRWFTLTEETSKQWLEIKNTSLLLCYLSNHAEDKVEERQNVPFLNIMDRILDVISKLILRLSLELWYNTRLHKVKTLLGSGDDFTNIYDAS